MRAAFNGKTKERWDGNGGKGEVAASAGAMLEAHTQKLGKHRMGEGGM